MAAHNHEEKPLINNKNSYGFCLKKINYINSSLVYKNKPERVWHGQCTVLQAVTRKRALTNIKLVIQFVVEIILKYKPSFSILRKKIIESTLNDDMLINHHYHNFIIFPVEPIVSVAFHH